MLFRYSQLCGTASDAADTVILLRRIKIGNPVGFKFLKFRMAEYLKYNIELTISKI
jgi:hypothetical protein